MAATSNSAPDATARLDRLCRHVLTEYVWPIMCAVSAVVAVGGTLASAHHPTEPLHNPGSSTYAVRDPHPRNTH